MEWSGGHGDRACRGASWLLGKPGTGWISGRSCASTGVFALVTQLPEESFLSWGWRVPFLLSFFLVLIGILVRYRLTETPAFKTVGERQELMRQPVVSALKHDWRNILLAIGITVSEIGLAYLLTVFIINYSTAMLGLSRQVILDAH